MQADQPSRGADIDADDDFDDDDDDFDGDDDDADDDDDHFWRIWEAQRDFLRVLKTAVFLRVQIFNDQNLRTARSRDFADL